MTSTLLPMPIPAGTQDSDPAIDGERLEQTVRLSSGSQPTPRPLPAKTGSHGGFPQVPGYEVLGVIGVGGMGIVYKARHRELNRIVALKMLGREWESDLDSRERFRAEAEAVAKLQHPNIIQLFDIGVCDRGPGLAQPYMTLEFVDGSSLSRHTGTPQEPRFAAVMVEKVARAAGAAHKLSVIHRDLKPANVLLTAAGEPKIADFGLAKQLEPATDGSGRYHTQAGMVVGTPEYMAPEQVNGVPPTPAVDVYALGVMLYELLTGRVPFKGANLTDTLLMVRGEEPVPPRRLQPKLPRDLETICLTCLAKSPDKRYATAEELADDLARWADGKTIRARPAGRVERVGQWTRRNPAVAGLLALTVLLVVSGVSAVVWKWREALDNELRATLNAKVERWERYRANLRAAATALEQGNASAARRALDDAPLEHRGWEWDALTAQLDTSSRVLRFPPKTDMRFVAASGRVVTHGQDGAMWAWDLATGAELAAHAPSPGLTHHLLCPTARLVAALGPDHAIQIRPFAGGTEVRLVGHTATVTGFRFDADGGRLASTSDDRTVRVWDTRTGELVATRTSDTPTLLHDFSGDGRRVCFTATDRSDLTVWDVAADRFTQLNIKGPLAGVLFSPDGTRCVATRTFPHNTLTLFDTATGNHTADLVGHENLALRCVYSADGKLLATCSMDRTVRLWDTQTGRSVATLKGHGGWVNAVAVSTDGSRIATGGVDKTVRLWTAAGQLLAELRGHTGEVVEVVFTADGKELYSASFDDGTVRAWDVPTAERRGGFRGHTSFVYAVDYVPDGERVVSASWDGTAALWDTKTGTCHRRFRHPSKSDRPGEVRVNFVDSMAVRPTGRFAATLSRLDGVRLWDLDDERDEPTPLHHWDVPTDDYRIARLRFSPDGRRLACGDRYGNVHLFDVDTREELAVFGGHYEPVGDVAFSPDGRWMVSAGGRETRVWDATTRTRVAVLTGHTDRVQSTVFSPDGRTLVTAAWDGKVRVWRVADWTEVTVLHHGVRVHTVAFHPHENRMAVGCDDSSIRLWDTARWQEVAELRGHHEYVHTLAFSPDGKRLVSGSGDKTVRLWDTAPVRAGR